MEDRFPLARELQSGGSVVLDRPLPLLCLWDQSEVKQPGGLFLLRLVRAAPSYAIVDGGRDLNEAKEHVDRALSAAVKEFGGCLVVQFRDLRTAFPEVHIVDGATPAVAISASSDARLRDGIDAFETSLTSAPVQGTLPRLRRAEPTTTPALNALSANATGRIVLTFAPVFHSPETGDLRRFLLREFGERLHRALLEMAWRFVRPASRKKLGKPAALGRRHVGAQVGAIEREICEISQRFDLILQLTPTNGEAAFAEFVDSGCERSPNLVYRPISLDPDELKRRLYELPIDDVEDLTLGKMLREQREHVDNQLSMLAQRSTSKCLYSSLHVYGGVEDRLYYLARTIPDTLLADADDGASALLGAEEFRSHALRELDYYAEQGQPFNTSVEIRSDVSSLTVAEGKLLIPATTRLTRARAQALVAHEVGTHLLTQHNGRAQPLALMSTGLAGYEQLQEGLAIVAEYLAAGLTRERLQLLAARVVAVHHLLNGASFVDVVRDLREQARLTLRHAFFVTLRVFRAGGFTKDAIYLRGLLEVLDLLAKGMSFESLLIGKFGSVQVELVEELLAREVLRPPAVLPRVLHSRGGRRRLDDLLGQRRTVFDLCERNVQ